ncbi:MAG: hypothetical protein ACREFI_00715 [Stellaceae bacterium]
MRWRTVLWLVVAAAEVSAGTNGDAQSTRDDTGTLFQDEGTKLEKSNKMWGQNDTCGKDSFRKFPDYTAEAALSRDAYMRDCLRKHHLPPRNDLVQPRRP